MGDKTRARAIAVAAGVPVVPAVEDLAGGGAARAAEQLGYPLLIKAAAGGGGKGMRIVRGAGELDAAFAAAGREATAAFGDGRLFLERYFDRPRHVEVQVLADAHGAVVHLGERECSIQRRYQKIVEESPSPGISACPARSASPRRPSPWRGSVGYTNAGTVEFLVTEAGEFYFLEMNTRLQVEHPITEWVSGVDLVQAQIRIAAGEPLWLRQDDIGPRGHAIECRIYAEDPGPAVPSQPGRIVGAARAAGPGRAGRLGHPPPTARCRCTTIHCSPSCRPGAPTASAARQRMLAALREYAVLGVTTNVAVPHRRARPSRVRRRPHAYALHRTAPGGLAPSRGAGGAGGDRGGRARGADARGARDRRPRTERARRHGRRWGRGGSGSGGH